MKETIYTIPINDAFDEDCSCAVCAIEKRLDRENIEHALGSSMMEPDFREISNKKGYCRHHYKELLGEGKALPLSLVLQSHSDYQNNVLQDTLKEVKYRRRFFLRPMAGRDNASKAVRLIEKLNSDCSICDRTAGQMHHYLSNIIYLWKSQKEFKDKFNSKNGFCMPHFSDLLKYGMKGLSDKQFNEFYNTIIEMQKKSLSEIYDDISKFTKLFDYNNNEEPSENVKTSVRRAIHKYSGLILKNDE